MGRIVEEAGRVKEAKQRRSGKYAAKVVMSAPQATNCRNALSWSDQRATCLRHETPW